MVNIWLISLPFDTPHGLMLQCRWCYVLVAAHARAPGIAGMPCVINPAVRLGAFPRPVNGKQIRETPIAHSEGENLWFPKFPTDFP